MDLKTFVKRLNNYPIAAGFFYAFAIALVYVIVSSVYIRYSADPIYFSKSDVIVNEIEAKRVSMVESDLQIKNIRDEAKGLRAFIDKTNAEKKKMEEELVEMRKRNEAEKSSLDAEMVALKKKKEEAALAGVSIAQLEKRADALSKKIAKSDNSEKLQEEYNKVIAQKNKLKVEGKRKKVEAEKALEKKLEAYFSPWDGSCRALEKSIKKGLNDPKSYEHDETTYSIAGDKVKVKCVFRAKNAFGGVVLATGYITLDPDTGAVSDFSVVEGRE